MSRTATPAATRARGRVFDSIAEEYDRHRPAYPDALVDRACEVGGLGPGAPVLEIGCGTGQLTRSLLARGLHVTAIEPGEQLIERARGRLKDVAGARFLRFVPARLEEARLPRSQFQAVFSASAIHWVDPAVGWWRAAEVLSEDGTLALLSYFGLREPYSDGDQQALRATLAGIAPTVAAEWPAYRDLDETRRGAAMRRGNVSEVWGWLGGYEIGRPAAAHLFTEAQLFELPARMEHTAEELVALVGTMSSWARLSPPQRDKLRARCHALQAGLGRAIRSSTVACLVTARRRPGARTTSSGHT